MPTVAKLDSSLLCSILPIMLLSSVQKSSYVLLCLTCYAQYYLYNMSTFEPNLYQVGKITISQRFYEDHFMKMLRSTCQLINRY